MTTARAGIPPATLQQIRDSVDIVDVVSRYVTLSKTGQNLRGLCPFHQEKTPSFTVTPARQMFYCFGCGVGGDIFTFLMRKEGLEFLETVKDLAERAGIPLPRNASQGLTPSQTGQRKRLEGLHALADTWFQQNLHDPSKGRPALAYLTGRGLELETLKEFGMGYAPPSWDGLTNHLTRQGATPSDLEASGLVAVKDAQGRSKPARFYDRFRGRVMLPIHDLRANVIAFGGRVFEEGTPKYLNSPDTALFQKGRVLYALHKARETNPHLDSLMLVEGYFDVLAMHQAGIRQVAAPLGTALTPEHAVLLRRFANTVVLIFDGDAAGTGAVLRALDVFRDSGVTVKVVVMPPGHDPDSYVRAHGAERFLALRDRALTLLEFAVAQRLEGATHATIEERTRRVDDILGILAKVSNPIEKNEQVQRVAERLGVRPQLLLDRYSAVLGRRQDVARRRGNSMPAGNRRSEKREFREERDIVSFMVQGSFHAEQLKGLRPEDFRSPLYRRLVEIGLRHLDTEGGLDVSGFIAETGLDETCRDSVAELAVSGTHFEDRDEYIQGCLRALEQRNLRTRLDELIAQLRIAEREQRTDDADSLNSQIETLRGRKAGLASSTS
ncbi:MAG: DNA primase [Nitrospira sp.]|nr:DNA primase [Nitrospira sp.]